MQKLVLSAMTALHIDLKTRCHLRVHPLPLHAFRSVFRRICISIIQQIHAKIVMPPANFAQVRRISVLSVRRDMNSTQMQHPVNAF